MKNLFLILFASAVSACNLVEEKPCTDKICTEEFRMISLKFKDQSGSPVIIKELSVKNLRTGQVMEPYQTDTSYFKGIYTIITDAQTESLSEEGDTIQVKAVSEAGTGRTVHLIAAGGRCACHISKISGPDEVIF